MSEWMVIEDWPRCRELERPGIVFELRNTEDLRLYSACSDKVPDAPWDWVTPPHEFRAVEETAPERSEPLPPPQG